MFNRILKELRDEKNLTQQELAEELGVARMTINFYESNRRTPDIHFAVRAANYFNVSVDYLVGNSNMKSKQDYRYTKDQVDYLVGNSNMKSKQDYRYTKDQVDSLEDIIYHLPASASQDLLHNLCEVLEAAHKKGIEREMLYLLSMTAYHSKFIANAESGEVFKAGCACQKEFADIVNDTAKQIEYTSNN